MKVRIASTTSTVIRPVCFLGFGISAIAGFSAGAIAAGAAVAGDGAFSYGRDESLLLCIYGLLTFTPPSR